MGNEYRIIFEVDERQLLSSDPWGAWRMRLDKCLRAVPELESGSTFSFQTPGRVGGMPAITVELRKAEIYVCENGDHSLSSRVIGIILFELVDCGFVVRFESLE